MAQKRIPSTTVIVSFFITSVCYTFSSVTAAEVALVANKASPLSTLTLKQAKKLWLGKIKSIGDSGSLEVIDLPTGNNTHSEFYKKIVKKSPSQLKVYWRKKIFSGKSFPPKIKDSDADVKQWVASTPSGLGYIDISSVDASVKVVLKVK